VRRWWGEFARTPLNETGVVVEVEVPAASMGSLACWLGCILLRVYSTACIS
jgi:hypothetical protein